MIGITSTPNLAPRAKLLAEELALPFISLPSPLPLTGYLLHLGAEGLELIGFENGQKHVLAAEFLKGSSGYRRLHGGGIKQALGKAVGIKTRQQAPTVLDGTAGLGKDAFVLACLGCAVTLLERSPIIAALLKDGLLRAQVDEAVGRIVKNKMKILITDLAQYLEKLQQEQYPDVIYLDPMFPERKKSALTKMEMRIIRDIVGSNLDTEQLLEKTLSVAKKRVVVKRPLHAPTLQNTKPNFVVSGSKNRYDVYLTGGNIKIHE